MSRKLYIPCVCCGRKIVVTEKELETEFDDGQTICERCVNNGGEKPQKKKKKLKEFEE